ncbi:formin-like protein 14 isoform X3 [Amblyraja radiata]|uniref:formin-like protein 14 isoform X3 n=1 Tax=Amblyraja radiata TaxID=386614 RepID=UPI0014024DFF|nr:formin-like protein 14 isoform X3 [Amblyraja radiata]
MPTFKKFSSSRRRTTEEAAVADPHVAEAADLHLPTDDTDPLCLTGTSNYHRLTGTSDPRRLTATSNYHRLTGPAEPRRLTGHPRTGTSDTSPAEPDSTPRGPPPLTLPTLATPPPTSRPQPSPCPSPRLSRLSHTGSDCAGSQCSPPPPITQGTSVVVPLGLPPSPV